MDLLALTSLENLADFGVAGIMGALWLWERLYSRRREQELTQAHTLLVAQHDELKVLVGLVQRNTAAMERFEQTQARLGDLLERMNHGNRVA